MAQKIDNPKGFKVIKMDLADVGRIGGLGICDFCNGASTEGYYIAVLNCWYCPKCYQEWLQRAKYYPEDAAVEQRNYINMQNLLEI